MLARLVGGAAMTQKNDGGAESGFEFTERGAVADDIKQIMKLKHPSGLDADLLIQSLAVSDLVLLTVSEENSETATFAIPADNVLAVTKAMLDAAEVCNRARYAEIDAMLEEREKPDA
jgi:hypothetical protein